MNLKWKYWNKQRATTTSTATPSARVAKSTCQYYNWTIKKKVSPRPNTNTVDLISFMSSSSSTVKSIPLSSKYSRLNQEINKKEIYFYITSPKGFRGEVNKFQSYLPTCISRSTSLDIYRFISIRDQPTSMYTSLSLSLSLSLSPSLSLSIWLSSFACIKFR